MTDQPTPEPEPAPPVLTKSRTGLWIGLGIAVVVVLGAAIAIPVSIGNAQAAAEEQARVEAEQAAVIAERERLAMFSDALASCNVARGEYIEILDFGEAINLGAVSKFYGPTLGDLYCVLGQLDAPSSLEAKIGATRALDGVQSDEWDGFEIEWRYHPDDGATVTIEHSN